MFDTLNEICGHHLHAIVALRVVIHRHRSSLPFSITMVSVDVSRW